MINLNEKKLVDQLLNAITNDYRLKGVINLNYHEKQVWDLVQQIQKQRVENAGPVTETSIYAIAEINLHGSKDEIAQLIQGKSSVFTDIISRGDVSIDETNVETMYIPTYNAETWTEEQGLDLKFGLTVD